MIVFENLERVLNKFGEELVENYKQTLIDKNINTTEKSLFNSVKYIFSNDNDVIEVNISLLEYYKYIEKGRAAGKYAPISAIENWVKIKPLIPRPNANGKLPTTKQLAYLVNRKIYTEGIEPKPILQENIYKTMSNFYEEIEKAIKEDLSGDFEIMLKELEL